MKKQVYFDALKWHNIYKCAMRNSKDRLCVAAKIQQTIKIDKRSNYNANHRHFREKL